MFGLAVYNKIISGIENTIIEPHMIYVWVVCNGCLPCQQILRKTSKLTY